MRPDDEMHTDKNVYLSRKIEDNQSSISINKQQHSYLN